MPNNLASALVYIIDALSSIVLLILLLRLTLPFFNADFRNPIAQGILKLTSPIIIPVRRLIPAIGRLDTATILVAVVLQLISVWLTFTIMGANASPDILLFIAVKKLLVLAIRLFIFAIFIRIVLSWIAPGQYNPVAAIANTISEPILRPFRQLIPALGGFDLSPILALIGLMALTIIVDGFQPFWL